VSTVDPRGKILPLPFSRSATSTGEALKFFNYLLFFIPNLNASQVPKNFSVFEEKGM
jgi:hypothetical protein